MLYEYYYPTHITLILVLYDHHCLLASGFSEIQLGYSHLGSLVTTEASSCFWGSPVSVTAVYCEWSPSLRPISHPPEKLDRLVVSILQTGRWSKTNCSSGIEAEDGSARPWTCSQAAWLYLACFSGEEPGYEARLYSGCWFNLLLPTNFVALFPGSPPPFLGRAWEQGYQFCLLQQTILQLKYFVYVIL